MPSGRKTKADGAAERLSDRTYPDFRQVFDEIYSSAGEGRMTLEVLKEISATLLRFFRCLAVEIVCEEKGKLLHAKSRRSRARSASTVWFWRWSPSSRPA
jgi:hypothetical protein